MGTSPKSPNSLKKAPSKKSPPQIPELKLDHGPLMEVSAESPTSGNSEHHRERYVLDSPVQDSLDEWPSADSTLGYAPRDILQDVG